jgi:hypothetical protein
MDDLPKVLDFSLVISQTQPAHLKLAVGSPWLYTLYPVRVIP